MLGRPFLWPNETVVCSDWVYKLFLGVLDEKSER